MDLVGQVICERYRILRHLGSGGMGTVYLAEHLYLDRPTALKILRRDLTADASAPERFRREAMLAARITHPAVAQIYDFDRTADGELVLAMEFVEGETVRCRLEREGTLTLPAAVHVLDAVAEGLDRAHVLNIVHRDLKPENIMLAADGVVKLLDFGVARPLDSSTTSITTSGIAVGTPAYMSPEQLTGDVLGPATDIYSLGIVFYEMLTGLVPHEGGGSWKELRVRRVTQPPVPLDRLRPECPPALSEVVARALDPEPSRRWPAATAFAEAAAAALRRPVPSAGPVPRRSRPDAEAADRWDASFEALRFAGREREIRQVRDAWAMARAGRPAILWIEGEEGAGKSAFFELARRDAASDGACDLVGRGYEADVARPYGPWQPMLRHALQLPGAEARPWPGIHALVDARPSTVVPQAALLFDEVSALLRAIAGRALVFVGMEDVDSCDAASLRLFEFLARDLGSSRMLLAVTAHAGPGTDPPHVRDVREHMRRLPNLAHVSLRPIGSEAVRGWLETALGHEPPEALVRYVYGNTEGNAFFIEQLVRALIERGVLLQIGDEQAQLSLANAPAPEAVAEVVRRRLERLSAAAREVIQIAAVIGREFDVDLVLQLSMRGEEAVLNAVDEAETAGILTRVTRPAGDWYRFTHVKIGQVHAQAMNPRRRRQLHARIAEALEARPESPPGSLAWHWYQAGERPRAAPAALAAARQAAAVLDYDDALTYAAMAAESAQAAADKRAARELRGDILRRLDRHPEAAAAYAHAQLAVEDPDDATALRCMELRSALASGAVTGASAAEEARKLLERAPEVPATTRAGAGLLLAEALLAIDDAAGAAAAARHAIELGASTGQRPVVAEGEVVLGAALLRAGDHEGALEAAERARRQFADLGEVSGLSRVGLLRGEAAAAAGDLAAARSALEEAGRYAERGRVTRLVRRVEERRAELGSNGPATGGDARA